MRFGVTILVSLGLSMASGLVGAEEYNPDHTDLQCSVGSPNSVAAASTGSHTEVKLTVYTHLPNGVLKIVAAEIMDPDEDVSSAMADCVAESTRLKSLVDSARTQRKMIEIETLGQIYPALMLDVSQRDALN